MADTFIKRPVLYKGTKAQIESATMGENDFAVATDVSFYTAEEVDEKIAGAGSGLEAVAHDATLSGTGTADSPLGIASTVTAQINSKADQTVVDVLNGEVSDLMGDVSAAQADIMKKVNLAQGAENAGKILKVDDEGNVVSSFANELKVDASIYGWEEETSGYTQFTLSETPQVGDLTVDGLEISEVGSDYIVVSSSAKQYYRESSLDTHLSETVNIKDLADKANTVVSKQDSATALNYNHISNCIIQIPQDINTQLNSGTFSVKAGSKVYAPNGSGGFKSVTLSADASQKTTYNAPDCICFVNLASNTLANHARTTITTSSTQPTSGQVWYNTTEKKIYTSSDSGATWNVANYSLPIARTVATTSGISEVKRVFNGLGFMGNMVFGLPGLKYLIPNYRNADGSLKSILMELTGVTTSALDTANDVNRVFGLGATGGISFDSVTNRYIQDNQPTSANMYAIWYSPEDNIWRQYINSAWNVITRAYIGRMRSTSGRIVDFDIDNVFRAMDYNLPTTEMPDYDSGVTIATGWVAPYNCVGFCSKKIRNNNTCKVSVNGVSVFVAIGNEYTEEFGAQWFVPKGATVTFSGTFNVAPVVYPLKGV